MLYQNIILRKNNNAKTNAYFSINLKLKNILFNEKYPELSFCDLKKLSDYCSTDEGCIYYKHNITNDIFTWNYITKKWI